MDKIWFGDLLNSRLPYNSEVTVFLFSSCLLCSLYFVAMPLFMELELSACLRLCNDTVIAAGKPTTIMNTDYKEQVQRYPETIYCSETVHIHSQCLKLTLLVILFFLLVNLNHMAEFAVLIKNVFINVAML